MKKFTYRIQKDFAMHFGPAGRLAEITRVIPILRPFWKWAPVGQIFPVL